MASPDQVKQYLAYWFQLGKQLIIDNGQDVILPQPVMQGDQYSPEFEVCWQRVLTHNGRNCYLEGTAETLEQLLSPAWDMSPCARCSMPVPMLSLGSREPSCPCSDMPFWPNNELPQPRSPIDTHVQLDRIRDRLINSNARNQSHSG
jgi:hypothetical protein